MGRGYERALWIGAIVLVLWWLKTRGETIAMSTSLRTTGTEGEGPIPIEPPGRLIGPPVLNCFRAPCPGGSIPGRGYGMWER